MNISISGVNRLLNKLERINHIKAIEALDSVAEDVKKCYKRSLSSR